MPAINDIPSHVNLDSELNTIPISPILGLRSIRHPEIYVFHDNNGHARRILERLPDDINDRLDRLNVLGVRLHNDAQRESVRYYGHGGWLFDDYGNCVNVMRDCYNDDDRYNYRLVAYSLPMPASIPRSLSVRSLPRCVVNWLNSGTEEELFQKLHFGIEIEFSEANALLSSVEPRDFTELLEAYRSYYVGEYAEFARLNSEKQNEVLTSALCWHFASSHGRINHAALAIVISEYRFDSETDTDDFIMCMRELLTRFSDTDYVNDDDEFEDYLKNWERETIGEREEDEYWRKIDGWKNHPDGTSGIEQEYVTDCPDTFAGVSDRLSKLFRILKTDYWECPTNGSCHVHVSIPGRHHSLGNSSHLGMCILFELSQCFDSELFQSGGVMSERIDSDNARQYFSGIETHAQKYSILHSHSQGSLEFRLFGHTDSQATCEEYLRMAGLAFIRGFKRYHEGRTAALGDKATFRERFVYALKNGMSMAGDEEIGFGIMNKVLNIENAGIELDVNHPEMMSALRTRLISQAVVQTMTQG